MKRQLADRCLTDARNELRQVRDWLLQPTVDTLDACPSALARAADNLRQLTAEIGPSGRDSHLLQPMLTLAEEVRSTQTLLHAAGELYFTRLRRLSAADGTPASGAPISVTG